MFRVIKIIAICMCFISTAFADEGWGWRHHRPHFYGYGNNGYYGGYVQPQRGYYPPPRANYYGNAQQMPMWGRSERGGRW